jgi:hypothetical protein
MLFHKNLYQKEVIMRLLSRIITIIAITLCASFWVLPAVAKPPKKDNDQKQSQQVLINTDIMKGININIPSGVTIQKKSDKSALPPKMNSPQPGAGQTEKDPVEKDTGVTLQKSPDKNTPAQTTDSTKQTQQSSARDRDGNSFWTTLPGMLTGIGSLIASLAAIKTAFGKRGGRSD